MARNLVPYGLLPGGNYGINLNDVATPWLAVGDPLAAALEVLETLPPVADPDNSAGRLVFSIADSTIFVYTTSPSAAWIALEGVPAAIGLSDGSPTDPKPLVTGSEIPGELFWTTDTEVLFVWDGLQWQAAGGRYATNVVEKMTTGDGSTFTYALGIASAVPHEQIEVFIDGVRQISLNSDPGTGDYSVSGTFIVFVVPPVIGAEVVTRAFETIQIAQNAKVIVPVPNPVVATVGDTEFDVGAAGVELDSIYVIVDGVTKSRGELTTVVSIAKVAPLDTSAVVITAADHKISVVGTEVTHIGALESAYNGKFIVTVITDSTTYEIAVLSGDPASATPNPLLEFSKDDYTVIQQDTQVLSISKASDSATVATVITAKPHGYSAGAVVTLGNIQIESPTDTRVPPPTDVGEPSLYNSTFDIFGTPAPGSSTFDIVVSSSTPKNITIDLPFVGDNDLMFFDPPPIGDSVEFFLPLLNQEKVDIRSFRNLVVAPTAGEANTLALTPGAAGESIVAPPVTPVLNTKGITGGSNVTVTSNATDIIITASTGANFETRAGWNGGLIYPSDATSYIGVLDTNINPNAPGAAPDIIVDLGISMTPSPGRKITIKDEGGLAGTLRNIVIVDSAGGTFEGASSSYTIATDRGSVTLVMDGSNNWNITAVV